MSRPAKKRKTHRLNLELSEPQMERIASIMDKTEAASATEVLRRAVLLYSNMIFMEENGNQLFWRDVKGIETKLVIS